MKKAQRRWLFISLGISLAVIFVMLIITIDADTFEALKHCIPAFLILSLVLHVASLCFWALRIKLMSHSLGYRVSFGHCFNLVCSNTFIANITPSQMGGEPVRVYELNKAGIPGGEATAIVIMERVFDGVVLAIGTVLCIFLLGWLFSDIQLPSGWMISAYIAAGVFAGLVILFFVFAKNRKWGVGLMHKIAKVTTRNKPDEIQIARRKKFENYTFKFYETLGHFISKSKSGIFFGLFLTILYWANEFIIAFFICMGLGVEPTPNLFLLSIIFQLLISAIMMLPLTPGSVGVAEISLGAFYAIIIPASIVGIFVLIYRFIFYYFNLAIGFVSSMIIVRREAKGKKVGE